MQIFRDKVKKILLHILAILILLRFFFFPIYNTYKEKKESLTNKINNYKTAIVLKHDNIFTSSNEVIKKVFNTTDEITYIQSLLLSFIQDLCKKNDIAMLHFELNEPLSYGKVSEITISLKLEGEPSNIISFLKNLETYSKIVDIKSFELLESQPRYTYTIVLSTYRIEDVK